MSDERALLAAICAHPDEDTPRLAYADWLDENVGSLPAKKRESVRMRAELIRVQCELVRLPSDEEDAATAARRIELEFREQELLSKRVRQKAWGKPLTEPGEHGGKLRLEDWRFIRGFPSFAQGWAMHFLTAGEAFFQISPVHTLKCTSHRADTPQLLAAPWLVRIRRLSISVDNEETSTELLFSAPTLAELEELELRSWRFRPAGSPVEKPTLASLRRLVLDDHRDGSQFVSLARLAELLHPQAQLREFVLGGAFYNASALADLAALPQLGRLERFTMHSRTGGDGVPRPPLTPTGIRALTTAPFWATLRAFRYESLWDFSSGYRYCGGLLDEPEAEELAAAPPNPHLRTFVLTSGRLGKAVSALASSPLLASVATLDLSGTPLGDAGADLLARSPYLGRLVRLNLAGCKVGPKGMKAIADAPWAANIVRMDIRGCPIRMQGVDALIAPGNFPRLKRLDAYMAAKTTAQKEQLTARYGNAVRFDCRD